MDRLAVFSKLAPAREAKVVANSKRSADAPRADRLVCRWIRDPRSGRLVCVWRLEKPLEDPEPRPCLRLVA